MSAALHLCGPEDRERLLPLVAAALSEAGQQPGDNDLRAVLEPLLAGAVPGAVWLIGPRRAPIGHIAVSFGYGLSAGGSEARIDQFHIRPALRRRGIGSEVLAALLPALAAQGLKALQVATGHDSPAQRLFARAGFRTCAADRLMLRILP